MADQQPGSTGVQPPPGQQQQQPGSENPPNGGTSQPPPGNQSPSNQPPPGGTTSPTPPGNPGSPTTSPTPPPDPTSPSSTSTSSSTSQEPTTSSSSIPPTSTSQEQPPPTSTTLSPSSSEKPPTSSEPQTSNTPTSTVTSVVTKTTFSSPPTTTSSTIPATQPSDSKGSSGLDNKAKVAIGVVVPIAAIALLAIIGLFWWKKRRARREEEEERRKEVEDYGYNPNAGPTIPAVGMMADGGHEMRDEGSSGYRGWGTTVAGSTGRKASTTLSGGVTNGTFSDGTGPSRGGPHEPYVDGSSHEGEILGAMGPSAAQNPSNVKRGPSNASSSYSAGGRSEGSDGGMYGGGAATFYDQYTQNPYGEQGQGAVIRDNPARRNTQIENSSHYPQQSAGIAQNF